MPNPSAQLAYQLRLPAPPKLLLLTYEKKCKLVFVHERRWLVRTEKRGQLHSVK